MSIRNNYIIFFKENLYNLWMIKSFVIIGFSLIILSSDAKGGEDFLLEYWERPIPLQNPTPPVPLFNKEGEQVELEKGWQERFSLYPERCGECHKEQYEGWKNSLHSKAAGPGLLSQIDSRNDPETAISCYYCHAPMEEQAEVKAGARGKGQGASNYIKNQSFDNKLKLSGVTCSVCHLREGKVYGPPAREVRSQKSEVRSDKGFGILKSEIRNPKSEIKEAHNGFIEKEFFQKSEFCAACHQMDGGYELNGKVLTNTYREWKESIYGEDNITCQNCHMPDRQHLWRGIHDPEMVQGGIHIEVIPYEKGGRLVITNTAVGHFFPTYVTPLVVVKGFALDKKGKVIPSSVKEAYIGRKVSLNLETEIFDTRIAPQKSFEFDYTPPTKEVSNKLVFEVWVYPDEFYNIFFKSMLTKEGVRKDDIKKALSATEKSRYRLFRKEMLL